MNERDIFRPELIQWLGLLRNMSRSSCVYMILSERNARRLLLVFAVFSVESQGIPVGV